MSVSLTNPFLLLGLTLAVIPIAIHLLFRERPKPVELPTARFVRRAIQRQRRSRKLRDILLLLLRIVSVAILALILTRPVWRNSPFGQRYEEQAAMVVLLDDAFYGASRLQGQQQIALAKAEAQKILQRLTPGSKAAVATTSLPPSRLTIDLDFVQQMLHGVRPGWRRGDARRAIASAAEVLRRDAPDLPKRIVLICDLNLDLMGGSGNLSMPDGCTLEVIPLTPRVDNASIVQATTTPRKAKVGQPVRVTAHVTGETLAAARVSMRVNDQPVATKGVRPLENSQMSRVEFQFTPHHPGDVAVTLELELEDSLALDNTWHLVLPVQNTPRILVLGDHDTGEISASLATQLALAPSSAASQRRYDVERGDCALEPATLPHYDAILFCGDKDCSASLWRGIEQYVRAGGVLVLLPEPYTKLDGLHGGAMPMLPGTLQTAIRPAGIIPQNDEAGRLLGVGSGVLTELEYTPRTTTKPTANDLARYADGLSAISRHPHGNGMVVFCGLPVRSGRNPLYLQEPWPPFLQRLLTLAFPAKERPVSTACGMPLSADGLQMPPGAIMEIPRSAPFVISAESPAGFTFLHTHQPGHYRLHSNGETLARFAVNLERTPHTYRFLPEQELAALAELGKQARVEAARGRDLSLATPAMLLLGLVLAMEPILAGGRRSDTEDQGSDINTS